jgi:hypothetical protein
MTPDYDDERALRMVRAHLLADYETVALIVGELRSVSDHQAVITSLVAWLSASFSCARGDREVARALRLVDKILLKRIVAGEFDDAGR